MGVLVLLLTVAVACNRTSQAQQLAALDEAYKSGVFTKGEYDAKRASILGAQQTVAAAAPVTAASPPAPAPAVALANPAPAPAAPLPPPVPAPSPRSAPSVSPAPAATTPPPEPAAPNPVAKTEPRQEPEPNLSPGCQEAEYAPHKDERSESRFFPLPPARVKKALEAALTTLDFTIRAEDARQIEATKNRHIGVLVGAGGEREILRIETSTEKGQSGTRVTGQTKKSLMGRLAQKSWTAAILAQTACNLR